MRHPAVLDGVSGAGTPEGAALKICFGVGLDTLLHGGASEFNQASRRQSLAESERVFAAARSLKEPAACNQGCAIDFGFE
jgi:hypothetical protein